MSNKRFLSSVFPLLILLSFWPCYQIRAAFFSTNGPLATARYFHTATLLLDGRVLVAGGITTGGPESRSERWPVTYFENPPEFPTVHGPTHKCRGGLARRELPASVARYGQGSNLRLRALLRRARPASSIENRLQIGILVAG